MKNIAVCIVAMLLALHDVGAAQIGIYTFTGATGDEATLPVDTQPSNAVFSVMSRGSGLTASAAANTFSASGWTTGALDTNDYYEFSITPADGASATYTNLSFTERRSGTGIGSWLLASSLDGYASGITNFTVPDNTSDRNHSILLGPAFAGLSSIVTFRLYGFTSEAAGGTWRVDNVALSGDITGGGGGPATNVQFTASSASVSEAAGSYTVTVFKTTADGNVSGEVAISGTATQGISDDYTIDTTNFTMNGATTSATFVVTLNNDTNTEPSKTVGLTLANVTGGTIVSPSVFTLTITDDDVPPVPAEGIAAFRFTSGPHLAVTTKETNITATTVALSSGTIETNQTTGTVFPNEPFIQESSWTASSQASAKRFQFTITPDSGYQVSVTGISFRALATGSGPTAFGYDIGGLASFAANFTNDVLVVVSQSVAGVDNQTGPVLIQIQGWTNGTRASSGVGDFRLDDVVVFGTIETAAVTTNVRFTASSATVGEAAGTHNVTVFKNLADGNVSGEIGLGGSATIGGGNDYTINTTNFALNGATTSATFTITINDDAAVESTETVVLTLANVTGGDVASPSVYTLSITNNDVAPPPSFNVWINELHYDNQGPDTDDGFEIAGASGTDLSSYNLLLYNGSVPGTIGQVYSNRVLSGVIPNQSNGYGAVWFSYDNGAGNGTQNGPDGVALVVNTTTVIQFLSYEGTILAVNGAASGMTSEDIGVVEAGTGTNLTVLNNSLQLCGTGTNYASFAWTTNSPNTRGLINACQSIPGGGGGTDDDGDLLPNDWESQYFGGATNATANADNDSDTYLNIEEFVAGSVPTNGLSYPRVSVVTGVAAGQQVQFPSTTGRLYWVDYRTNLLAGDWQNLQSNVAGSGATLLITDTNGAPQNSYRFGVKMAP